MRGRRERRAGREASEVDGWVARGEGERNGFQGQLAEQFEQFLRRRDGDSRRGEQGPGGDTV